MAREIQPIGGRPLLFKKSTDYTRIAVHKVTALDGNTYNMIFSGTGAFADFTSLFYFTPFLNKRMADNNRFTAKCYCMIVEY